MLAARTERQRSTSPFPGLRSFSQNESELFFGRQGQSDELARKLGQTRFIAVVGTSGSGKSSLVRAGLLPSLEGGYLVKAGSSWRVVDMRPGSRPIDHLAAALDAAKISESPVNPDLLRNSSLALVDLARAAYEAVRIRSDDNVLILVDQFEEIFRYKARDTEMADRDEKAAFVKLLLEVAKQRDLSLYVVITMRSDFLGDCARFRQLPETVNAGQYLVPRMTRDQRREAIEGPIHMAGSTIAPRLVQSMLNDVGEDPDQLPVMQHALMRTWSHWGNKGRRDVPVDIEDYEAIGTLENALSTHADEAYAEACAKMPQRGHQIVKRVFQCLRERDSHGRETRRPTPLHEMCAVAEASPEEVLAMLECFRREGRSFLMPPMSVSLKTDLEVDITHESLLRKWKRLLGPLSEQDKGWLAEEEESRRIILRLADRADQHRQESTDYLRGPLLQLALDWWHKRMPNKAWAQRYTSSFDDAAGFLRESEENRKREVEQEAERREKEEQARLEQIRRQEELKSRKLKVIGVYVFGILALIVATVTSALLWYAMKASTAEANFTHLQQLQQQAEATRQRLEVQEQARREAAKHQQEVEELLKDEANAEKARNQISIQLLASKAALVGTEGQSALPLSMLLAAESMRRQPLIDSQALVSKGLLVLPKPLGHLPSSSIQLTAFSPDGLLVTNEPGLVRVWDPVAKNQLTQIPLPGNAGAIAVSSDGRLLAVAYDEEKQGTIRVHNLRTGELDGQRSTVQGVSHLLLGGNGNLTAFSGRDSSLSYWKDWSDQGGAVPGAEEVLDGGGAVATSSDQRLYALFDRDQSKISVHDRSNGANNSWPVDQASVTDIVFDPSDKDHLASFDSGTIRLWSASSQQPYLAFQAASITGIEFSADGRFLAANSSDGTVRIWDTRNGREVASVVPKAATETASAKVEAPPTVALDGVNRIVAITQKGSTQLWQIAQVPLPERIIGANISTDGTFAALQATRSGVVLLWNIANSQVESQLNLSPIKQVLGISPSLHLAVGLCEGRFLCVVRFDKGTGTLIRKSRRALRYQGKLTFSTFSGAGQFIAVSTSKQEANGVLVNTFVWDINTKDAEPEIISEGSEPLNAVLLGFSPESDRCILSKPPAEDSPGEVKLWDLKNKVLTTRVPKPFQQPPLNIAFSADGRWLATSKLLSSQPGALTEQNYSIAIWRWPGIEKPFKTFDVDTRVDKMSFSPDDRFLITAGAEGFIRVWDVSLSKPKENGRVAFFRSSVPLAMTFVGGDRRILAFDQHSVTDSLWRPKDLGREVCERIGRSLSEQEWNRYLPEEKGKYFSTCEAYMHR